MSLLLIRVAAGVFLFWSAVAVVIAAATFTLTARDGLRESGERATLVASPAPIAERPRPRQVPPEARLITSDTTIGDLSAPSPGAADAPHLFFWLTCDDRLLTISTTRETIYAELDCSRYWLVHEVVRPYQGRPVRVRIGVVPPAVLILEATAAGAARFEVDAVWIETR